jgi:hypothetical protein
MQTHARGRMSLFGPSGSRKYLNAAERRPFSRRAVPTLSTILKTTSGLARSDPAAEHMHAGGRVSTTGFVI